MVIVNDHLRGAVRAIKKRFDAVDGGCKEPVSLLIAPEHLLDVFSALRDE